MPPLSELARLFPSLAGAPPLERRALMKVMAASLALAGCEGGPPGGTGDTRWFPAVIAPPGIVPGIANRYTTAGLAGGTAIGLVVDHRMGRPVKVEGNPLHPASLGATDGIAQAMILDFYDPARASGLLRAGTPATGADLLRALLPVRTRLFDRHGAGLRLLTGGVVSPTLGRAIDGLLARLPDAGWHQHDPLARDACTRGTALAYGRPLDLLPRAAEADVIVGFESDLISAAPGWVRHARDVTSRRNPTTSSPGRGPMSRIVVAESVPSLLGAIADHRVPASPAELHTALLALRDGVLGGVRPTIAWVAAALDDLRAAHGRALVHAGPDMPAEAHAIVHAINEALGARGVAFDLIDPVAHRAEDHAASLRALMDDMAAGQVDTLLMLDVNPVWTAPGFGPLLARVATTVHSGPAPDETARTAGWHVPMAHAFEAWGDLLAHDGTATICQPQALPLFGGRAPADLISLLLDAAPAHDRDAVRETWRGLDDATWLSALADGVVPATARAPVADRMRTQLPDPPAPPAAPVQVLTRFDPYLLDGRHANNGWLQELPRPFTKLVWDNPLLVSPALANSLGVENGDVVSIGTGREAPVWVLPGLAASCAVATIGYGRVGTGPVGAGIGWDATPLAGTNPALRKTGRRVKLATTDRSLGWGEHADILRQGTLAGFQADPGFLRGAMPDDSLYRVRPAGAVGWGMSVDLNACIGCNACVVACSAENNVPVVGRDNVLRQREMHWLRIDRYWDGEPGTAQAAFQPMLCQHCEEAPCETVCPVEASVHDEEGLNLQVYNRCIGTRFCSNNCPYKVRRFNFGPYAAEEARPAVARNPEVSTRARGVMEKCTFCVQRIADARIRHDRDGVPEQAVTACQAACPTGVFTFGDIKDPDSAVSAKQHSPLTYVLLPEQQTHPRLTYEARIRNAGPA